MIQGEGGGNSEITCESHLLLVVMYIGVRCCILFFKSHVEDFKKYLRLHTIKPYLYPQKHDCVMVWNL